MATFTGFQRDQLMVIAGLDNPSGQALKEDLEKEYDSEINHGRLYPNLDTLVYSGFVEKGTIDRRTNSHQITEEGRSALTDHLEWEQQYF
ncbi:PadR family transcriptional regulator [Halobium palmae]|uniref:PadR family transcriptional regulator n=1 Tax=Halobium palmae TaxID=1776492 RepID=A0ABD5RVK0_9EURY